MSRGSRSPIGVSAFTGRSLSTRSPIFPSTAPPVCAVPRASGRSGDPAPGRAASAAAAETAGGTAPRKDRLETRPAPSREARAGGGGAGFTGEKCYRRDRRERPRIPRVLPDDSSSAAPSAPASGAPSGGAFLADAGFEFRRLRRLAEAAVRQVGSDEALHRRRPEDGNSLAILLRHLAGNLRSRWTDFLTTDGEKPDRNREGEFDSRPDLDRAALLAEWDAAFEVMERELAALGPEDLERSVTIRGEPFTVRQAILRQLTHLAYHAGQVVLLARVEAAQWNSLSIPRGSPPGAAPPYRK